MGAFFSGRQYGNILCKQTQNMFLPIRDKHIQRETLRSLTGGYQHFRGSYSFWVNMKMRTAGSSTAMVTIYNTTHCFSTGDHSLNSTTMKTTITFQISKLLTCHYMCIILTHTRISVLCISI